MKFISLAFVFLFVFGCTFILSPSDAATIVSCGNDSADGSAKQADDDATTESASDVDKFFRTVHCTLEKAKPVVEHIDKELKSLRTVVQSVGDDLLTRLVFFYGLYDGKKRPKGTHSHKHNSDCDHTTTESSNSEEEIIPGFGPSDSVVENTDSSSSTTERMKTIERITTTAPSTSDEDIQEETDKKDKPIQATPSNDTDADELNEIK